jgi:hypothetical protein
MVDIRDLQRPRFGPSGLFLGRSRYPSRLPSLIYIRENVFISGHCRIHLYIMANVRSWLKYGISTGVVVASICCMVLTLDALCEKGNTTAGIATIQVMHLCISTISITKHFSLISLTYKNEILFSLLDLRALLVS